jgi:hypothetical protein
LLAILLYIYHTEIWDDIYPLLLNIKNFSNLYLSLYEHHNNDKIISEANNLNLINISLVSKNHGVDISPFLHQINKIDNNKYPYFVKLHSKKSLLGDRICWRSILYNSLIGSQDIVQQNLKLFTDDFVGAVTDKSMIMNKIGHNKKHIDYLSRFLNLKNKKKKFMGGSMFMGRTVIFQKYLNDSTIPFIDKILEDGSVKDLYEGKFCHAMERIFGKIVLENNIIKSSNIKPLFKIYNKEHKQLYAFYITHNNYCYNQIGSKFFGKILKIDEDWLCIEWKHLLNQKSFVKNYRKNNRGYYIGIS